MFFPQASVTIPHFQITDFSLDVKSVIKNSRRIVRYWRAGDYDVNKFYRGLATKLMLRFLVRHEITTAYIPEVLVCMRTGGMSNAGVKNRIMANRMDRKAWAVNGLKPYPWTLLMKPLSKIGQYFWFGKEINVNHEEHEEG